MSATLAAYTPYLAVYTACITTIMLLRTLWRDHKDAGRLGVRLRVLRHPPTGETAVWFNITNIGGRPVRPLGLIGWKKRRLGTQRHRVEIDGDDMPSRDPPLSTATGSLTSSASRTWPSFT